MTPRRRPLTPRQEEVLVLVGDGHSYPAIAAKLGISLNGVRRLEERLRKKLGARNKQELVVAARRYFMRAGIDG